MDFNHNQTHVQSRPQPEPFVPTTSAKGKNRAGRPSSNGVTSLALVLIVLILIAFGLLWFFRGNSYDEASQINKSEYQAIFLTNGQVYFGHLQQLNPEYAKLTNIFYLQVQQTVQPKEGTSSNQNQNVQLVKLGNELHGPEDAMQINRSQIIFWENLKPSGKVTEAIANYYKNGGSPSGSSTTPSSSTNNSSNSSSSTTNPGTTGTSSTTGSSNK